MNLLNGLPILAISIAQMDVASSPALTTYGPIGIICAWLIYRDEKRAKENEKLRESIGDVAHQMKNLSRALLYTTATTGPQPLRDIAAKELERAGVVEK